MDGCAVHIMYTINIVIAIVTRASAFWYPSTTHAVTPRTCTITEHKAAQYYTDT